MVLRLGNVEKIEVKEQKPVEAPKEVKKPKAEEVSLNQKKLERPEVLDAKVYKLKSKFVKHSIYITLSYIKDGERVRPYEIFINSKDLTKAPEFAVLTRLISAIFRKTPNPTFILEELKSIHDPNGGYFSNGKYFHSLYAEIADVMEKFFVDVGLIKKESDKSLIDYAKYSAVISSSLGKTESSSNSSSAESVSEEHLKICPECNMKTLKVEAGCYTCINPECNYSKCD